MQVDDDMTGSRGQEVYQVSELEQAIELRGKRRGARENARRMIISCRLPLSQIVEYTLLDQDTVEELAFAMGVILPDNWIPPWPHPNEACQAQGVTPGASQNSQA